LTESEADFRIRELNDLFQREFDRRATDNAVRLLKQIAKEVRVDQCGVAA
jgi:hypothetical protein